MRYTIKHTPLAAAMLLALNSPLYSPLAMAAPGDTAGVEFLVNTTTTNSQINPSIALDADGDFVIAWQSYDQEGSNDYGIYAQHYTADGTPAGDEFLVNTYTTGEQTNLSIALDADGDFVIAWKSYGQDDVVGYGIYAQRYSADGSPAGGEFQVNTYTTSSQESPSIALDADGDFVIAWDSYDQDGDSYGVYAQRYTADGTPAGGEFRVNTFTTSNQSNPSIALDADGDFVIAWQSPQGSSSNDVYARRYTANGTPAGDEFRVNTTTASSQSNPSIALDADGDFVIAWQSDGQDVDGYGIYAQRYTADGTPAGDEFLVNTTTTNSQRNPSIALDADGDFVIAWQSFGQDGSGSGIYAQRYSADGTPVGDEFRVNTYTTNTQNTPSIALDADGDFVIAWESTANQDGSDSGIYAQRFEGAGNFAAGNVDLNLVVQDDTDPVTAGNNFVYSLATTNNGSGIAMDVNLSEPLPAGLSYVSDDATTSGWSCALLNTTLNCNKPFMNAAETNTINVTVTADTAGTLSNTVTVNAAQTDTNTADNADTETTEVTPAASGGGGGGSLGILTLLLALPLWLRRRWFC